MQLVRLSDELIEIRDDAGNPKARAEMGPELKTAIASEEILSDDVTAGHYQVGKPDKRGKPIVLGAEFAYLDWRAPHIWHVYEFCTEDWTGPNTLVLDAEGNPVRDPSDPTKFKAAIGPAWRRRGAHQTEAEAVSAATLIAGAA